MQAEQMTTLTDAVVRLNDPTFYHENPHPVYAQLREEAPLYWYETGGFWVATGYETVQRISKEAEIFSSASGVLITDVLNKVDAVSTMFPEGVENFFIADAPRHGELRSLVSFAFQRKRISGLEQDVDGVIQRYLQKIVPGEPVDVVSNLSVPVPIEVIAAFLDLNELSVEDAFRWSEAVFQMGADLTEEEYKEIGSTLEDMFSFFGSVVADRRSSGGTDFVSTLVETELDGKKLVDMMVALYCQTLMVAGNETTRTAISAAIKLFADHPSQYQRLLQDESLIDSAVEEILRFHSPVLGFMRTAMADTELEGQQIASGDKVYMVYGAANRDPAVFQQPEEFDIDRFRKPFPMHLAFGLGEHMCMGASLARMELRILLKHFRSRYSAITLAGEPERINSLLGNGFEKLPVIFEAF
jgi:cytochrome P450